jgi:hypothetical protein
MNNFNKIINWKNVFDESQNFQNKKPSKFAFIENLFHNDFYEKLYETYPEEDDGMWYRLTNDFSRSAMRRNFANIKPNDPINDDDDPKLSPEWNEFKRFMNSKEFAENISKLTGITVTRPQHYVFINLHKGDFNLPHNHFSETSDDNPNSYALTILLYFTKNWKQGEPGGTYMCANEDESSIIFEPYNLDNSMVCFAEGLDAWHGSRYITSDTVRQSIQLTMR